MLENRSCRTGYTGFRNGIVLLRAVGLTLLFSMALLPNARAQGAGGTLHTKPQPTAFYTPEGQQQIADAILTSTLDQLWDQADAHYDSGEYNHSVNLYRIQVQGEPTNMEAYANASFLLWSTGQSDAAIAILKQGIAANPDNYALYDELGKQYYLMKDYANAAVYYEQGVKFKCPFFTWTGLAHSYEKLGQWDKAVKAWERATSYVVDGSTDANMKRNLARAKAELAKRQKQ